MSASFEEEEKLGPNRTEETVESGSWFVMMPPLLLLTATVEPFKDIVHHAKDLLMTTTTEDEMKPGPRRGDHFIAVK